MLIGWEYWDLDVLEGYTNGESIIDKDCYENVTESLSIIKTGRWKLHLCGIFPLSETKEAG